MLPLPPFIGTAGIEVPKRLEARVRIHRALLGIRAPGSPPQRFTGPGGPAERGLWESWRTGRHRE
jgi:hypothetical protein